MDVLEPETIWVNGRRYRFFESNMWSNEVKNIPYREEYQTELDDVTSEACENDGIVIEKIDGGRYKHCMDIPSAFYGYIIGYQGTTKKKLERETQTMIKVPMRSTKDLVTIMGITKGDVISCKQRIDLLMASARKRMMMTHFVSIPLRTDTTVRNYESFRDGILKDAEFKNWGIVEEMFTNPNKLHLTIGMLLLLDEKEKKEAVEALNDCIEEIVKPILKDLKQPLTIKIEGLDCMNDDPSKVSVLYGKICPNETVQEIADKVFAFFVKKQLMHIERTDKVKLHMTVIKSSKIMPKDERRGSRRSCFDAKNILKTFETYNFGEVQLKTLEICQRDAKEADGSYKKLTKVELT